MRKAALRRGNRREDDLKDESGNSLIELALVLPVFLLVVFGLINFALVMFGLCNITYASRAALRYATLHSSANYVPTTMVDINNIVNPWIFGYPQNTVATTMTYGTTNVVGGTVVVSVTITYNVMLPFYTYSGLKLSTSASGVIVQ